MVGGIQSVAAEKKQRESGAKKKMWCGQVSVIMPVFLFPVPDPHQPPVIEEIDEAQALREKLKGTTAVASNVTPAQETSNSDPTMPSPLSKPKETQKPGPVPRKPKPAPPKPTKTPKRRPPESDTESDDDTEEEEEGSSFDEEDEEDVSVTLSDSSVNSRRVLATAATTGLLATSMQPSGSKNYLLLALAAVLLTGSFIGLYYVHRRLQKAESAVAALRVIQEAEDTDDESEVDHATTEFKTKEENQENENEMATTTTKTEEIVRPVVAPPPPPTTVTVPPTVTVPAKRGGGRKRATPPLVVIPDQSSSSMSSLLSSMSSISSAAPLSSSSVAALGSASIGSTSPSPSTALDSPVPPSSPVSTYP